MIRVRQDPNNDAFMKIEFAGTDEQIAQEFVGVAISLNDNYPWILKKAQEYMDIQLQARRIVREEDQK